MTSYLENIWYVAAWATEVGEKPLGRMLLDTAVVIYRDEDGVVHALLDRCPHRFLPLSMGTVKGSEIQCAYHGIRIAGTGRCVFNPHGSGRIPAALQVRSFPVTERYGLIWIWFGSPEAADPATIPDLSHLSDPRLATASGGYIHAHCNYELYTDNLLDLSHAQYIHASSIGSDAIASSPVELIQDNVTIHVNRFCPDAPPAPRYDRLLGANGRHVDHWIDMRWDAPAVMLLNVGATFAGRPRTEGVNIKATHIVTPETAVTTHYFYANSRDFEIDNADLTQEGAAVQRYAFNEEDKPVLEAQQKAMRTPDLQSLGPVLLACDAGAARVRRVLGQMIERERLSQATSAAKAVKDAGIPPSD